MKIETFVVPSLDEPCSTPDSQVVSFKITGPIRPNDPTVLRARKIVERFASPEELASFDWTISNQALVQHE